jgi:hypothetical protein
MTEVRFTMKFLAPLMLVFAAFLLACFKPP